MNAYLGKDSKRSDGIAISHGDMNGLTQNFSRRYVLRFFASAGAAGLAGCMSRDAASSPSTSPARTNGFMPSRGVLIEGVGFRLWRIPGTIDSLLGASNPRVATNGRNLCTGGSYCARLSDFGGLVVALALRPNGDIEFGPFSSSGALERTFTNLASVIERATGSRPASFYVGLQRANRGGTDIILAFAIPQDSEGYRLSDYQGGQLGLAAILYPREASRRNPWEGPFPVLLLPEALRDPNGARDL